jgi:PAS domain S-box-containing protein
MSIRARLSSLAFRIAGPVLIVCILGGIGLYTAVQRTFSQFAERQIGQLMLTIADDVYSLCDGSRNGLMPAPPPVDPAEARIRKAYVQDALEDYFRQKGLEGFIIAGGQRIALNKELSQDLAAALENSRSDGKVSTLLHAGKRYAVIHTNFPPWDWHIVLAKERTAYASLTHDIRSLWLYIAYVIVIGFAGLLVALEETVRKPIRAIIDTVRKGGQPKPTGVAEFDYLSGQLQQSIQMRNTLLVNLEKTHFIYSHDLHGNFNYLSPSVTAILGYLPEEFKTHYSTYLTDHPVNREVARRTTLGIQGKQQPPYDVEIFHRDGGRRWLQVTEVPVFDSAGKVMAVEGIARDVTEAKRLQEEREKLITELRKAMEEIRTLRGIIPICASCKKVRNDEGAWQQIEAYITSHTESEFTHGICPECVAKMYPNIKMP